MLHNPKWEARTKPDVFSLEGLIAWMEKQPPHEGYRYSCHGHCLLAQYFTAAGLQNVHMFSDAFWHGESFCPTYMGQNEAVAQGLATYLPDHFSEIALCGELTFGAALDRARKALGK